MLSVLKFPLYFFDGSAVDGKLKIRLKVTNKPRLQLKFNFHLSIRPDGWSWPLFRSQTINVAEPFVMWTFLTKTNARYAMPLGNSK